MMKGLKLKNLLPFHCPSRRARMMKAHARSMALMPPSKRNGAVVFTSGRQMRRKSAEIVGCDFDAPLRLPITHPQVGEEASQENAVGSGVGADEICVPAVGAVVHQGAVDGDGHDQSREDDDDGAQLRADGEERRSSPMAR